MEADNPASRLLDIIEKGKKIKRDEKCRAAWAKLLQVDVNDHSQLMTGLGKVMALPGQVVEILKQDVEAIYNSGSANIHFYFCINNGFTSQVLDSTWSTFIDKIDDHGLSNLRLIAQLIHTLRPRKAISNEETLDIRAKAEDLIEFVLQSDFGPDLKKFLVDKLKNVIDALDSYYITGAAPVLDAVAATLGHAYLNPEYRSAVKDTEAGVTFASKLASLANAVTVATAVVQIGASGVPLLTFAVKGISGL